MQTVVPPVSYSTWPISGNPAGWNRFEFPTGVRLASTIRQDSALLFNRSAVVSFVNDIGLFFSGRVWTLQGPVRQEIPAHAFFRQWYEQRCGDRRPPRAKGLRTLYDFNGNRAVRLASQVQSKSP